MHPYLQVEHRVLRDGQQFSSVHEKMIYLILASYAGASGSAFPSHQTIADAVPCGKTTVKACLASLLEKGLIEKEERFNQHGGQTSNEYHVRPVPDAVRLPGEQEPTTGATRGDDEEPVLKKQSLKKEPSSTASSVFTLFEAEIGCTSPWIKQQLAQAVTKTSHDVVVHAIEQAAAANVRKWQYVKAVIDQLHARQITSGEQIKRHESKRAERPLRTKQTKQTKYRSAAVLPAWVEMERTEQRLFEEKRRAAWTASVPEEAELTELLAQLI